MARGRPSTPKLSHITIVDAALELASNNREPTLGAVSRALGVHVTSLYNHVSDRDALINALRDAISERHADHPVDPDWESLVRSIAAGMHQMFREYPGLIVPFATTPVRTTIIGSVFDVLTAQIAQTTGSSETASAGVRALNALIIGVALDSLDPDTTEAHSLAALNLGVDSLIQRLQAAS